MVELNMVSAPLFMLIQDGDVLDCCQDPVALMWTTLNGLKTFQVAVGVINEEGKREIVGVCADFIPRDGGKVYYITSETDGYMRMVGKVGGSVELIQNRVCTAFTKGRLSDPCNFAKITLWEGDILD